MSGIHDGHRERIRQQFLEQGFSENTPPHKILELLLFYSIPRKDTNETAHRLIEKFGSIAGVVDAPEEELIKIPGITKNSVCLIKLILPVARAYIRDKKDEENLIDSSTKALSYLSGKFLGLSVETAFLLCLDNKGRVLGCPKLAEGDELCVLVSARTVVEQAFKTKATAVVLAHNHPKGLAFPSAADIVVTKDIAEALKHLGVKLLDHVIVADSDCVSMALSKDYKEIFGR